MMFSLKPDRAKGLFMEWALIGLIVITVMTYGALTDKEDEE